MPTCPGFNVTNGSTFPERVLCSWISCIASRLGLSVNKQISDCIRASTLAAIARSLLRIYLPHPGRLAISGFWSNREVLHGVVGFDEAAEAFHHLGAVEEFAEEFGFLAEFLVGDGLDEFLGGHAGFGVELGDLPGHGAGDFERVAFSGEVRDEAGLVRSFRLDGAAGKEQITDEAVADIAAEARNAAESRDEAEAK